jgi:TRAP-type C4-dicarboxylate transport system permease small subunit
MTFREKVDKLLEKFVVALLAILVIDVLWQVVSRYLLSSPSSFTDELAGFLLVWVGLFGSAYVAGKNEHLAIDLLVQRAGPARRKFLEIFISSCIVLFSFFVLVVGGAWLVYTRFALDVKSAALEIPLGYVYSVLPISGLLIIFFTIDNTFQFLKGHKEI